MWVGSSRITIQIPAVHTLNANCIFNLQSCSISCRLTSRISKIASVADSNRRGVESCPLNRFMIIKIKTLSPRFVPPGSVPIDDIERRRTTVPKKKVKGEDPGPPRAPGGEMVPFGLPFMLRSVFGRRPDRKREAQGCRARAKRYPPVMTSFNRYASLGGSNGFHGVRSL